MHPLAPQVTAILQSYLAKAQTIYGRSFPMPSVGYDLEGNTAGQASYRANHIRLNSYLLDTQPNHLLNNTLPHELAHLVTWQLHGEKLKVRVRGKRKKTRFNHHGAEWQDVMIRFGLKPDRCHSLPTKPAVGGGRTFRYVCSCRKFTFTTIKHKKAQRGVKYTCLKCKKPLIFLNEILETSPA